MISKRYYIYLILGCFIVISFNCFLDNNVLAQQYYQNYKRYYPVKKVQKTFKPLPSPSPTIDPLMEEQKKINAKVDILSNQVNQSKNNILLSTEEVNNLRAKQNEILQENDTLNQKNNNFYNLIIALSILLLLLTLSFILIILKVRDSNQKTINDIRNQQLKNTEQLVSDKIKDFDHVLNDNYKSLNDKNSEEFKGSISDFEKNISLMISKYVQDYSARIDAENNKPEALEVKRYLNSIINKEKEISGQIERIHISNTYFNTANSLMRSEFYDDAIEEYEEAIKANPNFYGAYLNLGKAYEKIAEQSKAIETYLKSIKVNPNYYKAYYNLAHIYFGLKNYDKAVENYEKVLELKPDNYRAYNNIAIIYNYKGDKAKAQEYYIKSLEINKNYVDAYFNLVVLESDLEKKDNKEENNIFHISALYMKKYNAQPETIEKVDKLLESHINKKTILAKK